MADGHGLVVDEELFEDRYQRRVHIRHLQQGPGPVQWNRTGHHNAPVVAASPMSRHKATGYGDRICGAYASQVCIHRQNAVAAVEPDEQVLTGPAQTDNSRSGGQLLIRRSAPGLG